MERVDDAFLERIRTIVHRYGCCSGPAALSLVAEVEALRAALACLRTARKQAGAGAGVPRCRGVTGPEGPCRHAEPCQRTRAKMESEVKSTPALSRRAKRGGAAAAPRAKRAAGKTGAASETAEKAKGQKKTGKVASRLGKALRRKKTEE